MGAQTFTNDVYKSEHITTAKEAFAIAVEEALYAYGHAGYTGTIAEKDEFVMIAPPAKSLREAEDRADDMINRGDPRIDDKWGPAGCIHVMPDAQNNKQPELEGWLFFGWASN